LQKVDEDEGLGRRKSENQIGRKPRASTGATGAVTLVQRFGSALNLKVHFHMVFLDLEFGAPSRMRGSRGTPRPARWMICSATRSLERSREQLRMVQEKARAEQEAKDKVDPYNLPVLPVDSTESSGSGSPAVSASKGAATQAAPVTAAPPGSAH
jgi:hypothetical protein